MSKPADELSPHMDREWLLELATALQTSLDVEALVDIFARHVATLAPHDGVAYRNDKEGIRLELGHTGKHSLQYRLALGRERLGRLRFSRARPYSPPETTAIEAALASLKHPLRNALMYRQAVNAAARDPLTGVNNRAGFLETVDREVVLSRRHGAPLSLIMLDVDRFKAVNDEHGHLAGDMALKAITSCLQKCVRESDMLFRYGGDEFCVVLSNTSLVGARKLAERVRRAVESTSVAAGDSRLGVTASFGVATLDEDEDAAGLLEKVDASLYRAKALGRNRIASEDDLDAASGA
jgi:diguanylate cyclase (GGDEF)-like protein